MNCYFHYSEQFNLDFYILRDRHASFNVVVILQIYQCRVGMGHVGEQLPCSEKSILQTKIICKTKHVSHKHSDDDDDGDGSYGSELVQGRYY